VQLYRPERSQLFERVRITADFIRIFIRTRRRLGSINRRRLNRVLLCIHHAWRTGTGHDGKSQQHFPETKTIQYIYIHMLAKRHHIKLTIINQLTAQEPVFAACSSVVKPTAQVDSFYQTFTSDPT